MLIVAGIDHVPTHRVLVDGESLTNVLPLWVLRGWDSTKLKRCPSPLIYFSGKRVYPEGSIELSLTLEEGKEAVTQVEEFVVVDGPLAYNAILGRPAIYYFHTYHQVMKSPLPMGWGMWMDNSELFESVTPLP